MPQPQLQFFVIGTMKSGTTSLHHHLARHPALALPRSKEAPYFCRGPYYARGMDWYLREFFPHAREGQYLGTVSPQYMAFPGVAARIRADCPDARLIAILRHPIERAESHYRMAVRTFGETRSFQQAVARQLQAENLAAARVAPDHLNSYVAWSEYGRIVGEYRAHFPPRQLLVVFTGDLSRNPSGVLDRIFEFIGVENVALDDVGRRRHVSDERSVAKRFLAHCIMNSGVRRFGKRLLSEEARSRIRIWTIMNRDSGAEAHTHLSDDIRQRLARHYLRDAERLQDLLRIPVPWRASLENLRDEPRATNPAVSAAR